ncbi:MAG: hypothetical protein ABTQ26_08805 [Azonexus sp.]
MPEITEIRAAAQRLAEAHLATLTRSTILQDALAKSIKPIYERHRAGIDAAAEEEAAAKAELQALIDAAPQLFKRPRSMTVDCVKTGYRKADDSLDWDDEANVIARIRAFPELADLASILVRTVESLNVGALAELTGAQRRSIGVRHVEGVDQSFISFGDSTVDKVMKAIMADAQSRQGEDEAPKKKGKAKVKEVA